jgi:hypothetical protein
MGSYLRVLPFFTLFIVLRRNSGTSRSFSSLAYGISRPTTNLEQSSMLDTPDSSLGGLSLAEELSFLRRRVKDLERER